MSIEQQDANESIHAPKCSHQKLGVNRTPVNTKTSCRKEIVNVVVELKTTQKNYYETLCCILKIYVKTNGATHISI